MESLRSLTLRDCKLLAALDGTEKLTDLAWLQISGVNPKFRLPELSSFNGLKHLEINIPASQVVDQLGDLTNCSRLREIYVVCPSLLKFPSLKGMEHLEKLEFMFCDKVEGPLDCTGCMKLQTIALNGCENLSKLILLSCDVVVASPYVDAPNAYNKAARNIEYIYELKILQLWNMRELVELPSLRPLSNLSVLELVKCSIREPPDLTCCPKLENVYFFQLKNLVSFPIFSSLTELKKLGLCNCTSVQDPPDIEGCHKLQVFHLLYNDSMKGFSKINEWAELEEIQVSWHSEGEVQYKGFSPSSCQANDNLEICLAHFRDERFGKISDESMPEELKQLKWLKGKKKLVKRYFRGVRLYYSLTAPFEDGDVPLKDCRKKRIILGTMDRKVTALSLKMAKDSQDHYWLEKVQRYFGEIEPAIVTSASSDIVEDSSSLLPLSPIQGEERMCLELADFFNTLNPNEKGIRVAGLYGMPGLGKTTLAKAFRRRNLRNFDGRVCYLDFSGDSASERLELVLQYIAWERLHLLFYEPMMPNEDDAQKVLLVLDNISDQNINEVNNYLGQIDFGKDSWILLSTRRLHVLENDFKIDSRCCMHVPSLQKKEAIAIFLERILKLSGDSGLTVESEEFASKFADKCLFKDNNRGLDQFHPLALKALGGHIFSHWAAHNKAGGGSESFGQHLREQWSHWAGDGSNDVFGLLDKVFDAMEYECRTIFVLLARRMGPKMSTEEAYKWLQENYNGGFRSIQKAVLDLRDNTFIEEIESEIHIHDLFREFAYSEHKDNLSMISYPVATMHGGARMCQELADLFKTVHQNEKGNRIVGLYGMPGQGKTTLCKTFCNRNLQNFDGKVCYLDFGRGNKLDRLKHALRCLYNFSEERLKRVTTEDCKYYLQTYKTLPPVTDRNERELLVLNNVTVESGREDEEVYCYLRGRINSWFLLVARSEDILTKNFKIEKQSCMRIPRLEEEEAISILLESAFPAESKLGAQDRGFALKCAKRCLFKEACSDNAVEDPTFHPLALITFGRHLFRKYDADLSQWAAEADRLEIGSGGGSGDVFIVVDKAFDFMDPKLRTLFVLLSLHMEPNMSLFQVARWLELTFKKKLEYIEEAARDLMMMGFIEEIEPKIRIHDFYLEFAQSKPRWLLSKCNPVTSEVGAALFLNDEAGVELVNLEYCQNLIALNVVIHRRWSISDLLDISSWNYVKNKVRFPLGMEVEGSLHIGKVSDFQVLNLSILNVLQKLYVNIEYCGEPIDLGDLTGCVSLREIYVSASRYACGLSKFPRIDGCTNLSKIVLNQCYREELLDDVEIRELYISSSEDASIPECCGGVKNQLLWNIVTLWELPNLGRISNLTVLKLYGCDVTEPPDVTCCSMLEEVYFFTFKNIRSFPSFSSLKKLKILCLCHCENVKAPPDIGGCEGLEVYHLLYNSGNYSESLLRQIDGCPLLREFRLSWRNRAGDLEWHQQDEILADWNDVMPKELEEWQWLQDKEKQVKKCWRRGKGYYCITASYASGGGSGTLEQVPNAVSLEQGQSVAGPSSDPPAPFFVPSTSPEFSIGPSTFTTDSEHRHHTSYVQLMTSDSTHL